jgi:hypothetical protein
MFIPVVTLSILLVLRPANVLGAVDHSFDNILPADLQNNVYYYYYYYSYYYYYHHHDHYHHT